MSQGDGKAPQGMTRPLLFGIIPPSCDESRWRKGPTGHDTTSSIWNRLPSCDESRWQKGPTGHDMTSSIWNCLPSCDESRWRKGPTGHDTTSSTWNHPPSCDESGGVKERPQKGLTRPLLFGIVPPPPSYDESGGVKESPRKALHDLCYVESSHQLWWVGVTEGPQQGMTWHDLFCLESSHQLWWVGVTEGPQQGMTRHDLFCLESSHQLWWVSEGRAPGKAWHDLFYLESSPQLWWVGVTEGPQQGMTRHDLFCLESSHQLWWVSEGRAPGKAWHDLFHLELSLQLWWVGVKEWPQQSMTWPLPLGIISPAVPLWWVGVEGKASEVCARPLFLCFGCFLLGLAACCRGLPTSSWSSGLLDCLGWNDTQAHFFLIVSARKSTGGSRFKNLPNPKMPNTIPGKQGEGGCIFIYIYYLKENVYWVEMGMNFQHSWSIARYVRYSFFRTWRCPILFQVNKGEGWGVFFFKLFKKKIFTRWKS